VWVVQGYVCEILLANTFMSKGCITYMYTYIDATDVANTIFSVVFCILTLSWKTLKQYV